MNTEETAFVDRYCGGTAEQGKALGQIIDRIGDKWTVMVIRVLSQVDCMRFNSLQREIPGISHRMLTLTLRGLERDGFVKRTAYATIPPRVEYSITDMGLDLVEPLLLLARTAIKMQPRIVAAQRIFDGADEGCVADASQRDSGDQQSAG